jgi:1,6-anhydro-N-acetylmuramate kinase
MRLTITAAVYSQGAGRTDSDAGPAAGIRRIPVARRPPNADHAAMLPAAPSPDSKPRFVVGTMTGTSIDGDIDVALVSVHGHGLAMQAPLVLCRSFPLGTIASDLRRIAAQEAMHAREFARIALAFGEAHASSIAAVCEQAGVKPDLAVLHGQTVFHAPPLSWQLLDPWPVAARLGCAVRYDLRGANIASGGQGAPITPLADFILFADAAKPKTILNLGGFANATLLPARAAGAEGIRGLDLCTCNHVLDRVAHTRLGRAFDEDGRAAAKGTPDLDIAREIAARLRSDPSAQAGRPRSLGTGDEAASLVGLTVDLGPFDACATVVEGLALALAARLHAVGHQIGGTVVVAGGSARHRILRERLAEHASSRVETSDEHTGIPVVMREAAGMAVLGALAEDGLRFTLPQVTGATSRVLDSARISPALSPDSSGNGPL